MAVINMENETDRRQNGGTKNQERSLHGCLLQTEPSFTASPYVSRDNVGMLSRTSEFLNLG